MKSIAAISLTLALPFLVSCSHLAVHEVPAGSMQLQSFEFLGCSGDWDGEKPSVRRLTAKDRVTFLVSSDATCGLEGHSPRVTFAQGSLDLGYVLSTPSDRVVMCDCEYLAKFTFGPAAMNLTNVTFLGQQIEHLGDWPDGR
jgi:hypothetical protein